MKRSVKPADSNAIAISVVVPVRDEESSIRILLESLLSQTLPPREIVISDGGSADATREIVEEFIGSLNWLLLDKLHLTGRRANA